MLNKIIMFWKKEKKMNELEKMEYEFFMNHRNYLREQKHNMENKFSHLLIYLSAGIFTISIGLFRIYDFQNCINTILISWLFSLLALISVLFSFIFSIKAYNTEIKAWDKTKKEAKNNINTFIMKILVNFGIFFLISSIILLFIFYYSNFKIMSDGEKKFVENEVVGVQKNSEPVSSGISPTQFIDNSDEEE